MGERARVGGKGHCLGDIVRVLWSGSGFWGQFQADDRGLGVRQAVYLRG